MKVLVSDALQPTQFTSDGKYVVETDKKVLLVRKKNAVVSVQYTNGVYEITYGKEGKKLLRSSQPIRITPIRADKTVHVINLELRPAWNLELNDNTFYNSIRIVYSEKSQKPLLVNEIGLERYIRGIAETGGETNVEYIQALLTAARTYAYYNILHCSKFPGEPYCLDATANSQVYKGANYTKRAPLVVAAQRATTHQVITYDDTPIIAPYFSHSDGRTRAWSEVWNGDYSWAKSVPDPCCSGMALYGHGVGMSGEGARYFAERGWDWKQILYYYYTGVTVKRGY
ncbi:MAG TPA: SpoIID/LytB domain-containing protein [Patescibacteria group bacterium]|nr:SpoIID/LytB domain-containing protein [Patescibacteria group bacterium]